LGNARVTIIFSRRTRQGKNGKQKKKLYKKTKGTVSVEWENFFLINRRMEKKGNSDYGVWHTWRRAKN
jgi:hypothetical protein